jgi:hypothetical protein
VSLDSSALRNHLTAGIALEHRFRGVRLEQRLTTLAKRAGEFFERVDHLPAALALSQVSLQSLGRGALETSRGVGRKILLEFFVFAQRLPH